MEKIVLASNNGDKIKEINNDLQKLFSIEVKSLKDLGLGEPDENGTTFQENALIKARYAFDKTGLPSLADDSGFCINSLNDFPGLCSARFIKSVGGIEEAIRILGECINPKDKRSYFVTYLAFIYKNENNEVIEKIFEGRLNGQFTFPARGNNGFGYSPCFTPDGYNKTFGEIEDSVRCKMNHRALALGKFFSFLKGVIYKI
jgi:XTP/dITP diphosphohydrolase